MAERSHWWTERCFISLTRFISFSDYLPTYLPIYLSIYLSLSLYLSIYLSLYLSIHPSIHLPVVVFYVLRATTACTFPSLIWPAGSAPAALASLLFDPPEPQIIGKTQCFATFLPFRTSASSFFWLFLFSDLLSSNLSLLSASALLCFSSVHAFLPVATTREPHFGMNFHRQLLRVLHGRIAVRKDTQPGKIAVRKETQSNRNNRMVLQKWSRKSTSELYAIAHVCRTSLVTFKQHTLEHVIGLN